MGITPARNAPVIDHLLYADDLTVFFRADINSCGKLKQVLQEFAYIAGLRLNAKKSVIEFSPYTLRLFRKIESEFRSSTSSKHLQVLWYLHPWLQG